MAEDQAQEAEENEDLPEGEEQEEEKKGGMSKLILFAGVPVILIVVGLGAAYFLGLFGGGKEEHAEEGHGDGHGEHAEHAEPKHELVFYDLPDLLVNLSAEDGETRYLKLRIALELSDQAAVDKVEVVMPRIIDNFQVYLRELRLEDLNGSAGIYRMREELLKRINLSLQNVAVQDVLFKEIIVQ